MVLDQRQQLCVVFVLSLNKSYYNDSDYYHYMFIAGAVVKIVHMSLVLTVTPMVYNWGYRGGSPTTVQAW